MARPQPGHLRPGHPLALPPRVRPATGVVRRRDRRSAARSARAPVTAGGSNIVVGFGPDAVAAAATRRRTRRAGARSRPSRVTADVRRRPSTTCGCGRHGTGEDVELDVARAVVAVLAPVAELAAEQPCFVYRDSRDLTGFIDGTENPPVEDAFDVALVPDGGPARAAPSCWRRSGCTTSTAFHARVAARPGGHHRAHQTRQHRARRRRQAAHRAHRPGGHRGGRRGARALPAQHAVRAGGGAGLYFLAFSADPSRFTKMMHRMFGVSGDGLHDHLTDFTHAGQRRVLLRAVARRPRRHPAVGLTRVRAPDARPCLAVRQCDGAPPAGVAGRRPPRNRRTRDRPADRRRPAGLLGDRAARGVRRCEYRRDPRLEDHPVHVDVPRSRAADRGR